MRSQPKQSRNLFLPQRSQPKQNRNRIQWQDSHPNQTSKLSRRTQRNQTRSLPMR
jgi:hypothetical protein